MRTEPQAVDVICQHSRDGTVIPMRVRIRDEDGEYQAYTIKNYKNLSHQGSREMPDGIYVNDSTLIFECSITTLGKERRIRLYCDDVESCWKMTAV